MSKAGLALAGGDATPAGRVFHKPVSGTQVKGASFVKGFKHERAEGRSIAFASDASNLVAGDTDSRRDIFVKNLETGAITLAGTAADGTKAKHVTAAELLPAGSLVL